MHQQSVVEQELMKQEATKVFKSIIIEPEITEEIINYIKTSEHSISKGKDNSLSVADCKPENSFAWLKSLLWQGKITLADYERRNNSLVEIRQILANSREEQVYRNNSFLGFLLTLLSYRNYRQ